MTPGVYIGLSAEAYHADPALGSNDIKLLSQCPADWWHKRHGPFAGDDEDTAAKTFGQASHCRIVEGAEAFADRYYIRPSRQNFPDALVTADDVKARLQELNLKVSGKKDDLIDRLLEVEPNAQVWDRIVDKVDQWNAGKISMSQDGADRIEYAARWAENDPSSRLLLRQGVAEVSIFWEDFETGVPLKARIDRLHPGVAVDYKTCARRDLPFERAVAGAIQRYRYDIQDAHYLDAVSQIAGLPVFGEASPEWLTKLKAARQWAFRFVFQNTDGAPMILVRELPPSIRAVAQDAVRQGIDNYVAYREKYGDGAWIETAPATVFDDSDFSEYGWRR